jgi:hypothetical protein
MTTDAAVVFNNERREKTILLSPRIFFIRLRFACFPGKYQAPLRGTSANAEDGSRAASKFAGS